MFHVTTTVFTDHHFSVPVFQLNGTSDPSIPQSSTQTNSLTPTPTSSISIQLEPLNNLNINDSQVLDNIATQLNLPNTQLDVPQKGAIEFGLKLSDSDNVTLTEPMKFIDVYMIPHTHCDAGWLKTMEEYYQQDVIYILDSLVKSMIDHPHRKFGWVEIAFLERWWRDQNNETQSQFRELYERGQLEFVMGGWVSNDEASVNYMQAINQMTLGHQFLQKHFGENAIPTVGWQIDPFGLSQVTPALFSQMCFDSHVGWRVQQLQNVIQFLENKTLEFVWRNSGSLHQKTDVLMHALLWGYDSPTAFLFEKVRKRVINTQKEITNIAQKLVTSFRQRAEAFRGNTLMWLWGHDFRFRNAILMFDQMDLVLDEINNHPEMYNVSVKYATPAEYFARLHQIGEPFPMKKQDFFPYQPTVTNAWVGYYTSRPTLKRLCRETDALQRNAEAMFTIAWLMSNNEQQEDEGFWKENFESIYTMRKTQGIMQHHDAITGTMKEYVNLDYLEMMSNATSLMYRMLSEVSPLLIGGENMELVRETVAQIDEDTVRQLTLFNSLPWEVEHYHRIDIQSPYIKVITRHGTEIDSVVTTTHDNTVQLTFMANLPPLGYQTYYLVSHKQRTFTNQYEYTSTDWPYPPLEHTQPIDSTNIFQIQNDYFKVLFDSDTGRMKQVVFLSDTGETEDTLQLKQQYFRYTSNRAWGNHYTFCNVGPAEPLDSPFPLKFKVSKTSLFEEFIIEAAVMRTRILGFDEWDDSTSSIITKIRLYKSQPFIELEEVVGPPGATTDLVSRFETDIQSAGNFFTDDSGLEILHRQFVPQSTIPANYYPGVYSSFIREMEGENPKQLTFLMDTPHGITSLSNGTLEIMIHRENDQPYANGEALIDKNTVTLRSRLLLRPTEHTHRQQYATKLNYPPAAFISSPLSHGDIESDYPDTRSLLSQPFPDELMLSTFEHYDSEQSRKVVVRVTNMLQSDGVDFYGLQIMNATINNAHTGTEPFSIRLSTFNNMGSSKLASVEERTLSLNQRPENCKRHHWHFDGEPQHAEMFGGVVGESNEGLTPAKSIVVPPLGIRSFFLNFNKV